MRTETLFRFFVSSQTRNGERNGLWSDDLRYPIRSSSLLIAMLVGHRREKYCSVDEPIR